MKHSYLLLVLLILGCDAARREEPIHERSEATVEVEPLQPSVESPNVKPREQHPGDWFRDVTAESGVRFAYRNGMEAKQYTLLETVGGGVAMLDYDVDGDLDLFFCGGGTILPGETVEIQGRAGRLYRNDGNCRFTDVTEEAGLARLTSYSHGVAVADYDRNGYPDLFVTGYLRSRLLKNEQGVFHDATKEAGITWTSWDTAAAWADINHDRYPDLYIAAYVHWDVNERRICGDPMRSIRDVCPPQDHVGAQDRIYRNCRDGTFEDITAAAGIQDKDRGLGVLGCDFNDDAWPDFYVANDGDENRLYLGSSTLPFKETGLWAGVAASESGLAEGSMGVDANDYNGDGRIDLFVTNFELENNSLYRGTPHHVFSHATLAAGLGGSCFPLVGFGTGFADFDLDGWQDLYICNGNVFYHVGQRPYYQPAFLYRNDQGNRFRDYTSHGGPYFSVPHVGRGAAAGDLDDDGDLDLVVVHQNDPVTILRNQLPTQPWTRIQLEGTTCDREAVGAKVMASYSGREIAQWVRSGAGYLSQSDQRLLFPLDAETAIPVTVQWPGGKIEVFAACQPRQTNELVEGHGQPPSRAQTE